mmetsp:Transcript_65573/g.168785  ORF Transcript_65573/g.168785 Transcript_65573/m.168785 type:complete len:256 (+) Transcript_65573:988-1755(+)
MPPHGALHAAVHSMENGGESARNAVPVVSNRAEWIEADEALILARAPAMGRHALLVSNQRERIPALDAEGVIQALVKELVLMVIAASTPRTHVLHLQLLRAFAGAHAKRIHRIAREHLQRGVQTELAVVQVDSFRLLRKLWLPREECAQARGKEDCVWVHLHRPLMPLEVAVGYQPLPSSGHRAHALGQLGCAFRVKFRALLVHSSGANTCAEQEGPAAVDHWRFASEYANPIHELHSKQLPLTTARLHVGEAEQ